MSKLYYNPNPEFGDGGPFEAESKETLADELNESFKTWVEEMWVRGEPRANISKEEYIEIMVKGIRFDFINGLEEVEDGFNKEERTVLSRWNKDGRAFNK